VVPLFSGYGAGAIVARLRDCDAKVLVVVDGFRRRGRTVAMKAVADEAAVQLPSLEHILVVPQLGDPGLPMQADRDVMFAAMPDDFVTRPPVADTDADSTFMIIYTSGTTGRPKGTVHVHGGFPVKAMQDMAPLLRHRRARPPPLVHRHRLDDGSLGDLRSVEHRRHPRALRRCPGPSRS